MPEVGRWRLQVPGQEGSVVPELGGSRSREQGMT